jgi:4-hydroxybutyrate CoA-transferase
MVEIVEPERIPDLLRPGMTVFVEGASGEPTALLQTLAAAPEASDGVHYVGVRIPGVNLVDPASFHPGATLTSFFVFGDIAKSLDARKVRFLPLHYSAIFTYLAAVPVDIALIQVTPPDANGRCSLGPSVHFVPAVLGRAKLVVAEINAAMPRPPHSFLVPYERLDFVVETARPLVQLETGALSEQMWGSAGMSRA